jgi:hypothetical protein
MAAVTMDEEAFRFLRRGSVEPDRNPPFTLRVRKPFNSANCMTGTILNSANRGRKSNGRGVSLRDSASGVREGSALSHSRRASRNERRVLGQKQRQAALTERASRAKKMRGISPFRLPATLRLLAATGGSDNNQYCGTGLARREFLRQIARPN